MPIYTTTAAIEAKVPGPILDDALDDDGDGQRDAGLLDQIIANASQAVDALICNRIVLPLSVVPAAVAEGALMFAVEEIYNRREREIPKSLGARIAAARSFLEKVRAGAENLTVDAAAAPAITAGEGGQPYVPGRVPMGGSPTTY